MKSIFTKLSTLLLCGAVAMVSCTDFSEDIQNLDNKVNNLGNTTQTELATLQKAITDLEAKLSAQYATKDEVAALKTTLENSIASEVAALSEDIAEVSAALNAAKNEINTAIAGLDEKKADKAAVEAAVKTATEAIAALQAELEAAKGDLEAEIASVKEQIAATQESLQEQINGVDAKANELQNTLLSLGDYLKTLEAKVNEINNTLLSLGEYLPTIEAKILEVKGTVESLGAEYEANKEVVDAKLTELFSTLVSLSNHLEEYEATTDFKLVELQGSLAALSTYLEEYEASVDAKFNEILNTFESLSLFLDEKFAALEATDTDLYTEIEGIRVVLSALNNLLTDETAARESEDAALYELIGSSVTALNNLIADLAAEDEAIYAELDGVRQAFTTLNNLLSDEAATREAEDAAIYELIGSSVTALNNLIADLEAEDEAIYAEIENVRTYVAQVYNALSTEIAAVDAALQAHIAAFEAFKEAYEAKVDELEATDENLYVEINGLREVITTINNHIDDLRAEDEAIYLEINGLRENLTQLQNAINNRIDEEVKDLKADILEKFNILNTVILETEKRVNDKFNHTLKLIAENSALIAANAAAIADLEAAVEMLMDWVTGQEETNAEHARLIAKVYEIVGEMEEQIAALTQKDNELEGLIGKTAGALQTYMDENNARLADLEMYIKENFNLLGTGIRNLEAIINDLEASFGARLDALEERMDAAEDKIADLEDQAAEMSEAIVNIEAAIAELQEMDAALAAEIANVDAAAKKALKEAREELQDQIDALVKAKEDLEARVKVLEELVAANEDAIEDNRAEIEANIKAISNAVSQLGKLEGTVNAMMQANASIHAALQQKDAALEESIKKAVEALAGAVSRITAVEQSIEAIYALAETLATKEQLDNATADLTAKIEREIATLQGQLVAYIAQNGANIAAIRTELQNVNALIESLTERMDKVEFDVEDLNNRLDALIEEYTEAIAALQGKDAELESTLKTLLNNFQGLKDEVAHHNDLIGLNQIDIAKLFKQVAELEAKLNEKVAELGDRINSVYNDLVAADNFFFEYFTKEIEGLEKAIEAVRALVVDAAQAAQQNDAQLEAKLKEHIAKIIAQIEANITSVIVDCAQNKADIANLKAAVEEAFKLLNEKVSNLANRVQSLVYVPEYADHKATIEWATITTGSKVDAGFAIPTIIAKTSDLKYLVKAENAAEVASAIAANWSKVLDYNVTDVKTRGAAVSGADLEIVNVVADGEYIVVSVVAKNFSTNFFEKNKQGGIYSAALVLADGNNTRTSEYTNLVPGTPAEFQMNLFVSNEDAEVAAESLRMTENQEVIPYKMPCNDTELVKSAVKPIVGFVPVVDGQPVLTTPVRFYTPELLAEEGYDIAVDMAITIVDCEKVNEHDGTMDVKPDFVKIDPYFNIEAGNPVYDFHYTVKEGVSFENVGKSSTVEYVFTCGNVSSSLTYKFELANAQVDITITKTIPWSIAFAQKYIDGKKLYRFDAVADADEVTVVGADGFTDLESVLEQKSAANTANYVKTENGWAKTKVVHIPFQTYTGDRDANFALVNYSFNNSYKVVYTTTSGNVDYNTSIIVNLVGYQNEITVPIEDLKFNLDGKLGEFVTPADLKGEAYKKLTEKYDFLGFGEKNSENWDSMFASYVGPYSKGELGVPYVNGTKSSWVRNLNGLTEARLFWNDKAHQVIDGVNTITWSVNPVNDFTVKFVVSGEITKPAGSLIYADSYVEHGVAEAKGQLEKNGEGVLEYSIIESHLPFYFNATAIDYDAHDYTVKFEVKENTEVTLSNDVVSVLAKDGSYYPLENNAILDWAEYTGLEVEVVATLYANGYQIDQKELKIITKDPLHFTVGNVEAQRVMREDVTVQLFQNAVLTSSIEPEKENLISFLTSTGALKSIPFAFEYAKSTYGVDVKFVLQDPTAESHVYYFDNTGKKTYLAKTQYVYDEAKGHLTIKGDDAVAKNYYADFTAIMSSRICSGEHRVDFQVKFLGTK